MTKNYYIKLLMGDVLCKKYMSE